MGSGPFLFPYGSLGRRGRSESQGDEESPEDDQADINSEAPSHTLEESTVHWTSKQSLSAARTDERRQVTFMNPRNGKCHFCPFGVSAKTICNISTANFERLASGTDLDEAKDLCGNCLKSSVVLGRP